MAKQSDDDDDDTTGKNQYQTLTWGTWEELLLACAVHRYGTNSWDSVAMELQKRSSTFHHLLLTADTCQQKFDDLKRRFTDQNDIQLPENDDDDDDDDDDDTTTTTTTAHTTTVPWLDELKKLRVAELRRDVERYDLSIVSLQSKVKRLTEECEQSLTEREKSSDLENRDGELEKSPPDEVAGKEISGEVNVRDSQSANESNSTDPKGDNLETKPEEEEREPVQSVNGEPDPAGKSGKPAREGSCNGSSDTVAKESAGTPVEKADPARESGDSPESVAESKGGVGGGGGGEEGAKENSDMQSSVKSEPENDDQSPAIKRETVESQPLVDFLEMVRSHRLGSVFERRLESQETTNYRSLVRQHIDLETIRMRLQEGWYSGYNCKFFRDLLLLSNNALVFYGNKSSESKAAMELRQLVSKEMACKSPLKLESALQEQIPVPPVDPPIKPEPEPSDSLLAKQKIAVTLTVCRKRSSITAKASATSSERKKEQPPATRLAEEKPVINSKQQEKSLVDADEEYEVTKKRTRERHTPSAKTSTKNSKSRANNTNTIKNPEPKLNENSEPKGDKKNNTAMTSASASASAKKQGAANFLNRMKKGSSSNNGSFLDSVKSSVNKSDNSRGGAENKKNGSSKNDIVVRRDQPPRRGSNGRQVKEQESPTKRNVGRPPKRAAALPPPPPISGKRSREGGGNDAVGSSRQAKKRLRK